MDMELTLAEIRKSLHNLERSRSIQEKLAPHTQSQSIWTTTPPDDRQFDLWYAKEAQPQIQASWILRGHEADIRTALAITWRAALDAYYIPPVPPSPPSMAGSYPPGHEVT